MKTILMKITSRERYMQMLRCVIDYLQFANNPNEMFWLFSLDKDDPTLDINDLQQFLKSWGVGTDRYKIVVGESEGKIDAINRDIKQLHIAWDILLNISDDQFPIDRAMMTLFAMPCPTT